MINGKLISWQIYGKFYDGKSMGICGDIMGYNHIQPTKINHG